MGTDVYKHEHSDEESLHIYCHSRKDGKKGYAYLIINNSDFEPVTVELTQASECYLLTAPTLRSSVMELNGKPLTADEKGNITEFAPKVYPDGEVTLPPCSVMFAVL